MSNSPLSLVDETGTEGKGADAKKADGPHRAAKEKIQETIKNVQGEIDEIKKTSGPLQVEQLELVNARNSFWPDRKDVRDQLQKLIDAYTETLDALFDRTERLQAIIDKSQKRLKEFDERSGDPDRQVQLGKAYQSEPDQVGHVGAFSFQARNLWTPAPTWTRGPMQLQLGVLQPTANLQLTQLKPLAGVTPSASQPSPPPPLRSLVLLLVQSYLR